MKRFELFRNVLAVAAELAAKFAITVFWVGGGVRDFLLAGESQDYDFLLTEQLEAFGKAVAKELGGKVVFHRAFLHAVIDLPGGQRIDLGLPRRERYPYPGALPEVEPGTLNEDLARRDFTVNALAWQLSKKGDLENIIDLWGGLDDLKKRQLRFLRSGTFHEDPSRLVRLSRFQLKLGFDVEPATSAEARKAAEEGALAWSNPARLRRELQRSAEDSTPLTAFVGNMANWHWCSPEFSTLAERWIEQALEVPWVLNRWRLLLLALGGGVPGCSAVPWFSAVALTGAETRWLQGASSRIAKLRERIARQEKVSAIASIWQQLSPEELAILYAILEENHRQSFEVYRHHMTARRMNLQAADLLERGAWSGPELGVALARTRAARLDGEIGPESELEFAWRVWQVEVERKRSAAPGRTCKCS